MYVVSEDFYVVMLGYGVFVMWFIVFVLSLMFYWMGKVVEFWWDFFFVGFVELVFEFFSGIILLVMY